MIDRDLEEHHKSVLITILKYSLDTRILQRLLAVDFIFFYYVLDKESILAKWEASGLTTIYIIVFIVKGAYTSLLSYVRRINRDVGVGTA